MVSREERARQFLPFDALQGLQEALRQKEIEYEQKKTLSTEQEECIEQILKIIDIGYRVKIEYFNNIKYIKEEGKITNINYCKKQLVLSGKTIKFSNILNIEIA